MKNAILPPEDDGVRLLLDAALEVMRRSGTRSRPRVADIVAAAGLSNDAFYRHFPSKDDLVAALIEDGARRLARYLEHQMGKEQTPEGKVRRWVAGVLSQARGETAATTLAVLWNGERAKTSQHDASEALAALLRAPFADLGSDAPDLDASLAAHAVVGLLADFLSRTQTPADADIERVTAFCLRTASR
jgi:AcrR family transcriptional regulator